MAASTARWMRLTPREWSLVALGLVAWVGIGLGGFWLVRQFTRPPAACDKPLEAGATSLRPAPGGPRNALQLITRTGRCP